MIFPLVIAAVMAVLYIVIGMYSSLSLQTSMHLSLRKECGESTKTVYRPEEIRKFNPSKDRMNLRSIFVIDEVNEYSVKGIFASKIEREQMARSYIIDEAEIVRLQSLLRGDK